MLISITLDEALKTVERPELVKKDVVIPGRFSSASHSPYRPGYDWLFVYERKLARFLEPWLKQFRYELIGEKGILCEALSNAYYHGHAKDPMLPIEVRVYVGARGLIVRIEDSGNGFSVKSIYEKYEKGKAYFYTAGNGMRSMITSKNFGVFYDKKGSAFHLLYLFNEDLSVLYKNKLSGEIQVHLTEGGSGGADDTVSVPEKIKSNVHLVMPPEDANLIVTAILIEVKKENLAAFGIGREKLNALVRSCGWFVKSVDEMNSGLQIGKAVNISVRAPEGTLMISRNLSKEHVLISVLKEDANLVLAEIQLPKIFEYLYEKTRIKN